MVFLRACTALPGMAPTYVLRCPFSSATSERPPTEKRKNCLSSARAMDLPMLVLPTPGGPARHTILPCTEPFSCDTAINSRIRFLTSSSP